MAEDKRVEPPSFQARTQQLPAADKNEIMLAELKVLMVAGFADMSVKVDRLSRDVDLVKDRVGALEGRATRTSDAVRGASLTDLDHFALFEKERTARESLAVKVDVVVAKVDSLDGKTEDQTRLLQQLVNLSGQLVKLTEKPVVKLVIAAVGTAILTWLGVKGVH